MSATMTAHSVNAALLGAANAFGAHRSTQSISPTHAFANEASVDSHSLLQGDKVVTIAHNGVLYRLQATKLGKLILTK